MSSLEVLVLAAVTFALPARFAFRLVFASGARWHALVASINKDIAGTQM
jgi:hypothetical protein